VLRGDMSLVGPRPIVPAEAGMYGQEIGAYLRSRPGLTGAWQVSGRNNESYARRVAMDRNYVEHWSLWRDIVIMVRTVPVLLTTRGSY
jgi:exopolysaccharide production protein ExoY